jgi:hypothetical protein
VIGDRAAGGNSEVAGVVASNGELNAEAVFGQVVFDYAGPLDDGNDVGVLDVFSQLVTDYATLA